MSGDKAISSYVYSHLADDHFRIIEISRVEPMLQIALVDYPDDSPPEFIALSYAWGLETNTEAIICCGASLTITPHLLAGLQSIYRTSGTSRLWVDAICINQNDNQEKEKQVAKMHRIYETAHGVYVWLGKAEDGSDEAMDMIGNLEIPEQMPQSTDDTEILKILQIKFDSPRLFDVSLFKPLAALSRRSWFKRLWVLQECFFAKDIQVFCGSKQVAGDIFLKILRNLTINSFGSIEPPGVAEEQDLFGGFTAFKEVIKIKEESVIDAKKRTLFDFVVLGRSRLAKEPVDRIYAVFGMTENWDGVYQKQIPIDYSDECKKKYWRLYSTFGKIALLEEPNLRLLSIACSRERPEGLPSWCPNLHSLMATQSMGEESSYSAGWPWPGHSEISEPGSCLNHVHFKGKDLNHVSLQTNSNTIEIWGASLGQVKAIGDPRDWDLSMYKDDLVQVRPLAQAILKWLWQCQEFCQKNSTDDKVGEHIWHEVLVGAGNKARRPAKTQSHETYTKSNGSEAIPSGNSIKQEARDEVCGSQELRPDTGSNENKSTEGEETTANKEDQDPAFSFLVSVLSLVVEYDQNTNTDLRIMLTSDPLELLQVAYVWLIFIEAAWEYRILFATDNGYIGYASEDIKVGDDVVILYGGPTLYVLRQNGTEHRFISEAYVYGCVDGEIFEMIESGLASERLFSIA